MNVFLKILFLIISCISASECIYQNYTFGAILLSMFSFVMICLIINDIIEFINELIYGKNNVKQYRYNYYDNWYDSNYEEYFNGKNNYQLKNIEKKTIINKNIIEIGNATEVINDDEELLVDNTCPNKPKIHKSALEVSKKPIVITSENKKVEQVKNKYINSNKKSECILISNKLDKNLIKIYKIFLLIIKNQNLNSDKAYALMQSIYYVDMFLDNIVIYIDKNILNEAKLSDDNLQKEKVVEYIKKYLHNDSLKIVFEEIGHTSLLNYYLKSKHG